MKTRPRLQQSATMLRDQTQHSSRFRFVASNHFANVQSNQVDHDRPTRSERMDMRRRMIVPIDHDPQTIDPQTVGT
jgi:hypothetical protein